jgi:cupin 2 domain-containing protein
MIVRNLLAATDMELPEELTEKLATRPTLRIERIVSRGHSSPPGFWYDQEEDEWVLLLAGEARLRFADDDSSTNLVAGDFLEIPAHCRHRVDWTDPGGDTVWLAIFHRADEPATRTDPRGEP